MANPAGHGGLRAAVYTPRLAIRTLIVAPELAVKVLLQGSPLLRRFHLDCGARALGLATYRLLGGWCVVRTAAEQPKPNRRFFPCVSTSIRKSPIRSWPCWSRA